MEMPQVAAGCGPNQQQDPSAGRLFTSITQHATEANYTHIIICQLKIVLPPPPNSRAKAPGASTGPEDARLPALGSHVGPLLRISWQTGEMLDSAAVFVRQQTWLQTERPCLHPRSNTARRLGAT